MAFSWVTQSRPIGDSQVLYWMIDKSHRKKHRSKGSWSQYRTRGLIFRRHIYHHRVLISGLIPGQRYKYQVGNGLLMSPVFSFKTFPDDPSFVPRIAIYGDLGNGNGQSIPWLTHGVENDNIDIIFHIGDIAYDLDDDGGRNGDEFMRRIEPIASKVPYQTVPGNHEAARNFSHYDNLFANMDQKSGQINNHFYTTTVGPVRVIGISTEFYYFLVYGTSQIGTQFRWLENELIEANKPRNRRTHPWVVVMGHKPLYCSSNFRMYCKVEALILRNGWFGIYGLDKLFYDHKVDVYFSGHMHIYERMFPVFNNMGNASRTVNPYTDPWAAVHIVTGSAGGAGDLFGFEDEKPDWSANRLLTYGYSMLYPLNATHLRIDQISVAQVSDPDF